MHDCTKEISVEITGTNILYAQTVCIKNIYKQKSSYILGYFMFELKYIITGDFLKLSDIQFRESIEHFKLKKTTQNIIIHTACARWR